MGVPGRSSGTFWESESYGAFGSVGATKGNVQLLVLSGRRSDRG